MTDFDQVDTVRRRLEYALREEKVLNDIFTMCLGVMNRDLLEPVGLEKLNLLVSARSAYELARKTSDENFVAFCRTVQAFQKERA
jgi:hypothetical protein